MELETYYSDVSEFGMKLSVSSVTHHLKVEGVPFSLIGFGPKNVFRWPNQTCVFLLPTSMVLFVQRKNLLSTSAWVVVWDEYLTLSLTLKGCTFGDFILTKT